MRCQSTFVTQKNSAWLNGQTRQIHKISLSTQNTKSTYWGSLY